MRELRPAELAAHLAESGEAPQLLDVREPWEFDICHIEGSRLIPMGQLHAHLDELDREREIVVICHHGIRSRLMAAQLERAGFCHVINLDGGVEAWAREVDKAMPVY